jgi:multidrug efflux system membrane fusion protein
MTDSPPPTPPENTPPKSEPAASKPHSGAQRKIIAQILTLVIIFGAVVLSFWVFQIVERHPRTDDAVARANVVGIAPRVSGQILKVNVVDNQQVNEGDVLFELDPEDYELALKKAEADLATLDQQIAVARAHNDELKFQVKAAEAGVAGAEAESTKAADTLKRLQPLLPKGFATADDVEKADSASQVASAALAAAQQKLNQAKTALSELATLEAQRKGAVAAVDLSKLELSYCKVVAPFPGRVIDLNISAGAHATMGIPVFSFLDIRKWYVIANFREGELRHFTTGAAVDVFLPMAPDRHFTGKVQGIGWAVEPTEGQIDLPHSLPLVKRELNWVHVAQRFPVRIEIEDPDPQVFRMGATAVATIR